MRNVTKVLRHVYRQFDWLWKHKTFLTIQGCNVLHPQRQLQQLTGTFWSEEFQRPSLQNRSASEWQKTISHPAFIISVRDPWSNLEATTESPFSSTPSVTPRTDALTPFCFSSLIWSYINELRGETTKTTDGPSWLDSAFRASLWFNKYGKTWKTKDFP